MTDCMPQIGDLFLHVPGNAPTRSLIYTSKGYLPNDVKEQKRVWKEGHHCDNGMNECMTQKQFSRWWAEKVIVKNYDNYLSNKKKSTISQNKSR